MARKMISLAIVVIMVLGMAFAIAEEEKKVRLTTVSDAEVTTLLEKSNWMYTAEEESGELPASKLLDRILACRNADGGFGFRHNHC